MQPNNATSWMIESRRFLAENFRNSPDLRAAAFAAAYSPYHFHRRFKQMFGETPLEYVSKLRFEEAKRLLCLSSLSVSEVCLDVGYESFSTFSLAFSARYGCSPVEYRRIFAIPFQQPLRWIPACYLANSHSEYSEQSKIR